MPFVDTHPEITMSVRQSLLAILDQGPCYGNQLRHEFDRRTGSTRPLNVGQIYNTLERLERDGLVRRGETDAHGHVYWEITDAGSAEVGQWLSSPVVRIPATRDELAVKLAIAATLPGVDVSTVLSAQRAASERQLKTLQDARFSGSAKGEAEEFAWSLILDSMVFAAEAEVKWLDRVEQRLVAETRRAMTMEIATERPKRGRPASLGTAVA